MDTIHFRSFSAGCTSFMNSIFGLCKSLVFQAILLTLLLRPFFYLREKEGNTVGEGRKKEGERQESRKGRGREQPSFFPQMPVRAGAGPGESQEPESLPRTLTGVARTQVLESSYGAFPKLHASRKQDQKWGWGSPYYVKQAYQHIILPAVPQHPPPKL